MYISCTFFQKYLLHYYLTYLKYIFYSYCGISDPSWAELRHFIYFLNQQLESSERSVFTGEKYTGDILTDFKSFVVKFMIQMSRVR